MENKQKEDLLNHLQADLTELKYKFLQKEIEDNQIKKERRSFLNPVNASILVALLSILGAIIINISQQNANNKLEEKKLKSNLVLKALDAGDTSKISKMLLFFINNQLIEDNDSTIRKAANNSSELPITSYFNQQAPLPTLTIGSSKNPCKFGLIDDCWKTEISADPGDTIGVQIFYMNTSLFASEGTTLSIKPSMAPLTNKVVFRGGVASLTGPRSTGEAILTLSAARPVLYIPGSARWWPSMQQMLPVDEVGLFGTSGFNIGKVMPGSQGVLVANFIVPKN